jgi:hypothetical protein
VNDFIDCILYGMLAMGITGLFAMILLAYGSRDKAKANKKPWQ